MPPEVQRLCYYCQRRPITDHCLRCDRYLCAGCYDGLRCPKGCSPEPAVELMPRKKRGRA